MQIMDGEEQNVYPSYPARRIGPPPQPKLPAPVHRQVQPEPWRCRMCRFLCPVQSTVCPACGTPRRVIISHAERFLIACLMAFFVLFGCLLFLMTWDDSPVRTPDITAYIDHMGNLGCICTFVVPFGFFLLRQYSGKFATITALICAAVLLVSLCSMSSSFYTLLNWQSFATVVLSIFFLVTLIYGAVLRLRARLRRERFGLPKEG